jgi:hypothetical protein
MRLAPAIVPKRRRKQALIDNIVDGDGCRRSGRELVHAGASDLGLSELAQSGTVPTTPTENESNRGAAGHVFV